MKLKALFKALAIIILCGLIFYAIGVPCRIFLKISDFTELSFTASLPFLFTLIFGLPGAIGCAVANLVADIYFGYSPFIFVPGFFLQITYGVFPALAWNILRRKDENKYKLNSVLKVVQLLIVIIVTSGYNATAGFVLIFANVEHVSPALWTNYFFNQLNTAVATVIPFMILLSLKHQFSLKRRFRGSDDNIFSFSLNEKFLFFLVMASILVSIAVACICHEFFTYRYHVEPLYLWNFVYYGAAISMNLAVWSSLAFLLYIELTVTKPVEKMSSIGKVFGEESEIETKISSIVDRCQKYIYFTSEVGDLARSFKNMSTELDSYVKNLTEAHREKEKSQTELAIATTIQASTLPKLEKFNHLDLHAIMNPALEVGGDFYDFFMVDSHRIALVIADVSGKGVPAALFMMISKTILRHNLMRGYSPAEAMMRTNEELCANNPLDMFVSCFCGILDLDSGVFQFSNAGHEPPAVKKKDQYFTLEKIKSYFVLGGLPGMKYENFEYKMEPGDVIFAYTDGIPEAMNEEKMEFGNEGLLNALNRNRYATMENLCNSVHAAVKKHAGNAPQFDDISMLAFSLQESDKAFKTFSAKQECLEEVQNFVNGWSESKKVDMKVASKLAICSDEIVSNVVFYSGAITLEIQCEKQENTITLTFIDDGKAFDPLTETKDPDITSSAEDRELGGLGIFMVKKMATSVSYQRIENRNHITVQF